MIKKCTLSLKKYINIYIQQNGKKLFKTDEKYNIVITFKHTSWNTVKYIYNSIKL